MTLASDQSIQIAFYQIRKADLLPWSALAKMGPQLTGNAGWDVNRKSSAIDVVSVDSTSTRTQVINSDGGQTGLTFSQPLFDPVVFPAYRLGKLSAKSARLQHQFTVRQTLFGVAQAYYNVLKLQSVVKINQQTVDLATTQLGLAQARFDAGAVARIDVLRAKATLESARNNLIISEGQLQSNRDTLSNILNLGGKTDFELAEPPNAPEEQASFEKILSRAYEGREDYRVSAIAIDQDIAARGEIVAQYAPSVAVQASTQWTAGSGSGPSRTHENDAFLTLRMPFLTGGQREIDLRTANHQISQTRLNYEKTTKSIESEVKNAWLKVGTGRESIQALTAEVEAATQNYNDLQAQYEAGTATSLDVQSALRDLNNSRTLLSSQSYDYQVALRDLQRAEAIFEKSRVEKAKVK